MSKSNNTTISFNFGGLLFTVLVVLKLLKVISISWLWVFAPIWIPFGLLGLFGVIAFVVFLVAAVLGK